ATAATATVVINLSGGHMFFDEPGRRDQSQMMGLSPASRSILPTHLQWPTLAFALAASVLCFFDIDSIIAGAWSCKTPTGMAGGQRSALGQRFCSRHRAERGRLRGESRSR
ncbi:MAG: hypothetical protein ACJ8MR_03150, partial [Povalibacter sp.]